MLSFVAENGLGWYIQSNSRWKSHSSPGFMENMIVPSLDHSGGSRAHCGRAHRYRACMRIADELPDFRKDEIAAGEVLEIFFPSIAKNDEARRYETETRPYKAPTYAVREQTGREAQGFMNPDPLALRTSAPVRELTYGEYNLGFFFSLVDECLCIRAGGSTERTTMETQARGIEKVQALHDMGKAAMSAAGQMAQREEEIVAGSVEPVASPEASRLLQAMAPCALSLGDVNEEEINISDCDILFCYSSSFPAQGDLLTELSYTLGHKLRPGSQVITTDWRLVSDGPWEFALLKESEGPNAGTGGKSVAYLWEVVKSAL